MTAQKHHSLQNSSEGSNTETNVEKVIIIIILLFISSQLPLYE